MFIVHASICLNCVAPQSILAFSSINCGLWALGLLVVISFYLASLSSCRPIMLFSLRYAGDGGFDSHS